jgi:putative ABC transport system substrate-binding protein
MRRREFIAGLGSAAVWSAIAGAQQPKLPVVGFLYSSVPETFRQFLSPFAAGLAEIGFIEGRNVAFEYRLAEDHLDRLPGLADDLVRRRVAVIVAAGNVQPALAAKAVTRTIPIVFQMGADPVVNGVVTSLARPAGNITGFTIGSGELFGKRFEQLRELVPSVSTMGYLVNLTNTSYSEVHLREVAENVHRIGVRLQVVSASRRDEIDPAFAALTAQQVGALVVGPDTFFTAQRDLLVAVAARYRIPASFSRHDFVEAGGLMSFTSIPDQAIRETGIYVGRILKGEKPGDLPVQQPIRFELAINLKTARALGLTVPNTLLAVADKVIE